MFFYPFLTHPQADAEAHVIQIRPVPRKVAARRVRELRQDGLVIRPRVHVRHVRGVAVPVVVVPDIAQYLSIPRRSDLVPLNGIVEVDMRAIRAADNGGVIRIGTVVDGAVDHRE